MIGPKQKNTNNNDNDDNDHNNDTNINNNKNNKKNNKNNKGNRQIMRTPRGFQNMVWPVHFLNMVLIINSISIDLFEYKTIC